MNLSIINKIIELFGNIFSSKKNINEPQQQAPKKDGEYGMITMSEILKNEGKFEDFSPEIQANLKVLLDKANRLRAKYGKPLIVTSGIRSMEHHLEIYAQKGITDKNKIPMKSKHLFGQAVDFYDPKKELQSWCLVNKDFLKELGVWLEDFNHTPNWVHIQIVPYGSYKEGKSIWFIP